MMKEFLKQLFTRNHPKKPSKPDSQEKSLEEGLKALAQGEQFRQFEESIKSRFSGIEWNEDDCLSFIDYVSSLFMVDMMGVSFRKAGIILPKTMYVLDVGAGRWQYVNALYQFLRHYGEEKDVFLTGIDINGRKYQSDVEKLTGNIPAGYYPIDIFSFNQSGSFDMVFMAHMLGSPQHFEKWQVPYRPHEQLFGRVFELLKPGGIFVGTAYDFAGESGIFNKFPEKSKIYESLYSRNLGDSARFLEGYHTFNDNVILLGRKE